MRMRMTRYANGIYWLTLKILSSSFEFLLSYMQM
jgi:hypothetical protein